MYYYLFLTNWSIFIWQIVANGWERHDILCIDVRIHGLKQNNVRVIEGSYNGDLDNLDSTVYNCIKSINAISLIVFKNA